MAIRTGLVIEGGYTEKHSPVYLANAADLWHNFCPVSWSRFAAAIVPYGFGAPPRAPADQEDEVGGGGLGSAKVAGSSASLRGVNARARSSLNLHQSQSQPSGKAGPEAATSTSSSANLLPESSSAGRSSADVPRPSGGGSGMFRVGASNKVVPLPAADKK